MPVLAAWGHLGCPASDAVSGSQRQQQGVAVLLVRSGHSHGHSDVSSHKRSLTQEDTESIK